MCCAKKHRIQRLEIDIVRDLSRKQMGEDKTAVVVPKKRLCYTWECDNSDANGFHAVLLFLLSMGIQFFNMLYSYMACYWDIGSSSIPSPKHYLFCSTIYFWTKTNYRWKYYCINTCMTVRLSQLLPISRTEWYTTTLAYQDQEKATIFLSKHWMTRPMWRSNYEHQVSNYYVLSTDTTNLALTE